jgi:hypothetical protein
MLLKPPAHTLNETLPSWLLSKISVCIATYDAKKETTPKAGSGSCQSLIHLPEISTTTVGII